MTLSAYWKRCALQGYAGALKAKSLDLDFEKTGQGIFLKFYYTTVWLLSQNVKNWSGWKRWKYWFMYQSLKCVPANQGINMRNLWEFLQRKLGNFINSIAALSFDVERKFFLFCWSESSGTPCMINMSQLACL